jgi:transcription termination factor Rho
MPETATGIFTRAKGGAGVLFDAERPSSSVRVPAGLIRQYKLPVGARVVGPTRQGKGGTELLRIDSVCGLSLTAFKQRTRFEDLVAIDPHERFNLGIEGEPALRLIDLIAPIGRGTRGLIVSPPKAGKTRLLEQIGRAIRAGDPEARIIILLIDERPEEVTHFRRALDAEVFASSADQSLRAHADLAELMLAHIRTELECGQDVVVLMDSLTRMSRAYNLQVRGSGRSLTGGLDAAALEIPRRFFGVARNVENGGSVTLLATVLIDTGSRMDQFIYEEFKGTGNSEIVLDRSLADARLFPAINLPASGTRKEYHLYGPDDMLRLDRLRRWLSQYKPREALEAMLKLLDQYPTNEELLSKISPGR